MIKEVEALHPRHANSPLSFHSDDKSLLIPNAKKTLLITGNSVELDPHITHHKQHVPNKVALWVIIKSSKRAVTGKQLLRYFAPEHPHLSSEEKSIEALVQLINEETLSIYHWPYVLPENYFTPKVSPDNAELTQSNTLEHLEEALEEKLSEPTTDLTNDFSYRSVKPASHVNTSLQPNDLTSSKKGVTQSGLTAAAISETKTVGECISLATGEELLQINDRTLDGPLPLQWTRTYRSSNHTDIGLGFGWTHTLSEYLTINEKTQEVQLYDAEGRIILLLLPSIGERSHNMAEQISLLRIDDTHYVITPFSDPVGLQRHFKKLEQEPELPQTSIDNIQEKTPKKPRPYEHQEANTYRCALTTIENSHQQGYQLHYNNSRLMNVISYHGDGLLFDYSLCGRIHSVSRIDHKNNEDLIMKYAYNHEGDLIHAIDADDYSEHYQYHSHIITQRQLKNGYCFYLQWDKLTPLARCLRQRGDPIDQQVTYDYRFTWDTHNHQVIVVDSRNNKHTYNHNEQAQLTYARDAEGHETRYRYNEWNQLSSIRYPNTSIEEFHYNEQGQKIAHTNIKDQTCYQEYDEYGRVTAVINEATYHAHSESKEWRYSYNDHNQIVAIVNSENQRTFYRYNNLGLISVITNSLGHASHYQWNDRGQLTAKKDAMGRVEKYRYNDRGQLIEIHHALGQVTRYQYDIRGYIHTVITADHQATQYRYNALGAIENIIEPSGRQVSYFYNGLNQIIRRTINDGELNNSIIGSSSLHYHYDGERNLIGLKNEKGEHCQLDYDGSKNLIRHTHFDGRIIEYDYNKLGHIIQKIEHSGINDPSPIITTYQRNVAGQILFQSNADGTTQFAYDRQGLLCKAENQHRCLTWQYNSLGQVIEEAQDEYVIKHEYDKAGNRTQTQLHNGDTIKYHYNRTHQFSALRYFSQVHGQANHSYLGETIALLQHNHLGQETSRDHGNQLLTLKDYDLQGRLKTQGIAKKMGSIDPVNDLLKNILNEYNNYIGTSRKDYTYNLANQVSKIDDSIQGPTSYHYDMLNRLIQIEGTHSEYFAYDPAHNLISAELEQAPNDDLESQVHYNRIQSFNGQQFEYDSYGNRKKIKYDDDQAIRTIYKYNSQHQLTAVKNENGISLYHYDALGRRVDKQTQDDQGNLITTRYLWLGDNILEETQTTEHTEAVETQTYLFEPNSAKPLALIKGQQIYRYHLDHLGSTESVSNAQGDKVWHARYSYYGKATINATEINKADNHIKQPFLLQGLYADEETGLYYNRHRYYDTNTGSFITPNPIGLLGGINPYHRAFNTVMDEYLLTQAPTSDQILAPKATTIAMLYIGTTNSDQSSPRLSPFTPQTPTAMTDHNNPLQAISKPPVIETQRANLLPLISKITKPASHE